MDGVRYPKENNLYKKKEHTQIGQSKPRIDGVVKATGAGRYCGDLKFPNMLYGKMLTSPHAHAKILSIDTSDAEKIPGVVKIITHKDVPSLKYGLSPARWDENVLCIDKVRFVGDKVAAVACVDEETCYKALKAIKVEYEVLPAVLDYRTAMNEDMPQIHEEYANNINTEIHHVFGDPDEAFANAYHVRTDVFEGQRTYQCPIEPHSAISIWKDDKLTVYSSTQSVHYFQYYIAREFGLKMGDVRVIKPLVGGGFGGKLEPTGLEYNGSVLSKLTGRPVKMFYDRAEMFAHNRGRHQGHYEVSTAVDKDGKILGLKVNFLLDGGAYTSLGIATAYYSGGLLPLTYDFDNYQFDLMRMYTNLPACGAQRGHGAPQPKYALESHLDNVARDLGIDPLELRKRNARKPYTNTCNGMGIQTCYLTEALEKLEEITDWKEKKEKGLPKGRGIGMATGSFVTGAGYPIYRNDYPSSSCMLRVNEDGTSATLYSNAMDIGQGSDTVLCQMAAEAMGYRYENMKIVTGDTEVAPLDFGAYSSRQTAYCGWTVKRAGEEIKAKILETAGFMMHIPPEDLECEEGIIYSKSRPKVTPITFEEAAKKYFIIKGPLVATGVYTVPRLGGYHKGAAVATSPCYSFCTQAAEVQIDEETGEIEVLHAWDVHDAGQIINPALMKGQVHGAFGMGVSETIWEEVVFNNNGKIMNADVGGYRIITAQDMPNFTNDLIKSNDEPATPWGLKEIGEGSNNPTMGAVRNAIYDAIGVNISTLPLSFEKVWRAIKEKKEQEQISE
ncbi:MAG: CoxL [Firmicutes bacterium]|nr:CoxL [Bacillota bacterium]